METILSLNDALDTATFYGVKTPSCYPLLYPVAATLLGQVATSAA